MILQTCLFVYSFQEEWDHSVNPFTQLDQYLEHFHKTDEQVFMKIGITR